MSRRGEFQQALPGLEAPAPPARPRMTREVYNPYSAAHRGIQSSEVRRVIGVGHLRRMAGQPAAPVGLRGSIPERLAVSGRYQKKRAGEARWETLRERSRDEDFEHDDDYDEPPQPHPRTGLPDYGSIRTFKSGYAMDEHIPSIGFEPGAVPNEVSFHGSARSARRQAGTAKWIPVPGIRTPQETVSSTRVHQALESPETTSTPRLPMRELPHVFEESHPTNPGERIYTMIDGNHRMSANILQGKLFAEATVLTHSDIPKVSAVTRRISDAKTRASRKVDANAVEQRMNRNFYGDDY